MFEEVRRVLESYDTVIIHRHAKPDGDALGAQIGLKHLLRENYPEKKIYAVGDPAGRYGFMTDSVMNEIPDTTYEHALAVVLDTSAKCLISDPRYQSAAATVRIDHHLFCEQIAEIEVDDPSFESCCGMIAELARESSWRVPKIAAEALYTGMVTDSGRFRYDATTPRTLRLAAFLLEQGVDTEPIYRNLYADDYSRLKQRAEFLLRVTITPHGVAYLYNTAEEVAASGLDTFSVSRGMVSLMADIRGVDSWVNFTETEDGVLCELRSSRYDINKIAVKYGGGGHKKASGATVKDRATAMQMVHDLEALGEENND
ncbi:MAG: bifunctional oligoribonuclease/PAP phosphatase NrnA [Eubacteriales bacterium]